VRPISKHLLTFGTLAAALVLVASHASAQRATFTLPFQAHMGNVTLQPGEYRMSMPSATSVVRVIYLYSDGKVQAALPAAIDAFADSGRGYLELVNVSGTYFVKRLVSGVTATTYTFDIPKTARHEILANTRATSIPVTGGAAN
jgi:hypothetical protein